MAETSLADVIDRIKTEGNLERNSGKNSLKSIKDILTEQTDAMSNSFDGLLSAITSDALANKELKMENDRLNERLLQALEDLNNGGGGAGGAGADGGAGAALGVAGLALAGTIGGLLGVLRGQYKAIQAFSKLFTPKWVTTKFEAVKISMTQTFDNFKLSISERITAARKAITSGITRFKAFFTIAEDSPLHKLGQGLRTRIDALVDLFKPISETIRSISTGAGTRLSNIWNIVKGYMKTFADKAGKISRVVGKVFAPIAILTTAWETITGIIEGWKEDGFLGGLKGGIEGFATSLITIPLDLIKDLIAWVLTKLGFDKEAQVLKDFSFTTLFTNMLDGLFCFISDAIEWVKLLFTDPVGAMKKLWTGLYGEEGIFNTLLWKPISKGINWVMEKFGWKDDDPNAPDFDLFTFITGVWDTVVQKVKDGFQSFGNWLASIPARLKVMAFETIRGIKGGSFIIDDETMAAAESDLAAFTTVPDAGAAGSADALEDASGDLTETQTEREAAAAEAAGNATVGVDASTKIDQRSDTVLVETDLSARGGGWENMDQADFIRMYAQ